MSPESAQSCTDRGVELLSRGDLEAAASQFDRAIELEPGNSLIHFNLALTRHRQGRVDAAIDEYYRAIEIEPALIPAHNNLGLATLERGDGQTAVACFRKVLAKNANHIVARYNLGRAWQMQGERDAAIDAYRQVLKLEPHHARAASNLGAALLDENRLDEAEEALHRALRSDPSLADAHNNLGRVYLQGQDSEAACGCFEEALRCDESHLDARRNLAHLLKGMGDIAGAINHYRVVLQIDATCIDSMGRLAVLLEQTGMSEETDKLLEDAFALVPDDALLNLTAAKRERRDGRLSQAITRLESLDVQLLDSDFAGAICLEIGQLHDAAGSYAKAFENFSRGNELQAQSARMNNIDKRRFLSEVDKVNDVVAEHDVSLDGSGDKNPVFAVGFPRSGTTLLEKILGAHPLIHTLEEKPLIATLARALSRQAGPGGFNEDVGRSLRSDYFKLANSYGPHDPHALLIDKLPLNLFRLPFVHAVFPGAKVVFSVRHPFDVCLSCFMQSFEANSAMANFYSLDDTVSLYVEAMGRWGAYVDQAEITHHVVRYEDLISDLEAQARELLGFLGLPWNDLVLRSDEAARNKGWISTPSYHQVTRPIYRHALDRWRHYAGQLEPYRSRLMPFVEHFGYEGS